VSEKGNLNHRSGDFVGILSPIRIVRRQTQAKVKIDRQSGERKTNCTEIKRKPMFKKTENRDSVTFSFSSEMHLVDRTIQGFRDYLNRFNISEFSASRLVLRELLLNAVEHGNQNRAERTVTSSIDHLGDWQFRFAVEDEGEGFDPQALDMKMPEDPHQLRSRGYALISAFADKLEFNDKGNRITAYVSIPLEMNFLQSQDEAGWQIITPSGDITAGTADKFRAILVMLIDHGHMKYQFDFTHVEDIDSVALSVMIIFAKMLAKKGEGWQLRIVNAGNALTDLFHMTRMNDIYKVMSKT